MRRVGIVGAGSDKFTPATEAEARAIIRQLLAGADAMVSGHAPVGGIDIWAEEEATAMGVPLDLKIPEVLQWDPPGGYGFKARNLDIATQSTEVHVIVVDTYPPGYRGRVFPLCYHCGTSDHVKSGGCWTGKHAPNLATWHILCTR
jgi:hypothetical protein